MKSQKLLALVADDRFATIEAVASRPNFFRILGTTFTERWHSMFLAWLLDPMGSHRLGDFTLRRLLFAITSPDIESDSGIGLEQLSVIGARGDLSEAAVTPNENDPHEHQSSRAEIDILVQGIKLNSAEYVLAIEQKVNAPINKEQCRKYADTLSQRFPDRTKILVMLAPGDRLGISAEQTMGDSRWCAISYQTLHDIILAPSLRAPGLDIQTQPLLDQYIATLRIPYQGRRLAVTNEEKELAYGLYEDHQEAFELIAAALQAEGVDIDISTASKLPLRLIVDGKRIEGRTVPDFYRKILEYLLKGKMDFSHDVPFATGKKRYLIATSPSHPGGRRFFSPVERGGYFMETNKRRDTAIKDVARFLKKVGHSVTV